MCSEAVPWRCHRLIISNSLVARGLDVYHIISEDQVKKHSLGLYGANPVLDAGRVTYPK